MNKRWIMAVSLLLLATALGAWAEEQAVIAPRAEQLLRQASQTLAAAQTLTLRADVTVDEVAGTGQKLQRSGAVSISVRRPDRVLAEHDGDRYHRKLLYDGKAVTVFDVRQELWASFEAPNTIDAMLGFAKEKFGVVFPLGQVIVARPVDQMIPTIESGLYLGLAKVEGRQCHHLAFSQAAVDWQLWVEDGPTPLIRKLVVTYKTLPQSPQFTAVIHAWEFGKTLPENTFKLQIPQTASRIDFATPGATTGVKP